MTQPFQPKNFELIHELKNRIRIHVPILEKDPERTYIFEIILKKRPEIRVLNLFLKLALSPFILTTKNSLNRTF